MDIRYGGRAPQALIKPFILQLCKNFTDIQDPEIEAQNLTPGTHLTDGVFTRVGFKAVLWFTNHWRLGGHYGRSGAGEVLSGCGEGK